MLPVKPLEYFFSAGFDIVRSSPVVFATDGTVAIGTRTHFAIPGTSGHHRLAKLHLVPGEKRNPRAVGWERNGAVRGQRRKLAGCKRLGHSAFDYIPCYVDGKANQAEHWLVYALEYFFELSARLKIVRSLPS